MEMIPSSPSTTQSVVEGQVFEGAVEDHVEGPNPNIERVPPLESPRAQLSEEGLASTFAIVELMVASAEKLVKRTPGREEAKPELAAVPNLVAKKKTAPLPPLNVTRSPAAENEMVVGLTTGGESPRGLSKREKP